MDRAHETANQTQARLLEVTAHADFEVLPGPYAFEALPAGAPKVREDALACVSDGGVWSAPVPARRVTRHGSTRMRQVPVSRATTGAKASMTGSKTT